MSLNPPTPKVVDMSDQPMSERRAEMLKAALVMKDQFWIAIFAGNADDESEDSPNE